MEVIHQYLKVLPASPLILLSIELNIYYQNFNMVEVPSFHHKKPPKPNNLIFLSHYYSTNMKTVSATHFRRQHKIISRV